VILPFFDWRSTNRGTFEFDVAPGDCEKPIAPGLSGVDRQMCHAEDLSPAVCSVRGTARATACTHAEEAAVQVGMLELEGARAQVHPEGIVCCWPRSSAQAPANSQEDCPLVCRRLLLALLGILPVLLAI
jgi:hypothetical protein